MNLKVRDLQEHSYIIYNTLLILLCIIYLVSSSEGFRSGEPGNELIESIL